MGESQTCQITPEGVVERYRRFDVKPMTANLGVFRPMRSTSWKLGDSRSACALGVMMIDRPVSEDDDDIGAYELISRELGVEVEPFYVGFDLGERARERRDHEALLDHPHFRLGLECRRAVIEAGLVEGWKP